MGAEWRQRMEMQDQGRLGRGCHGSPHQDKLVQLPSGLYDPSPNKWETLFELPGFISAFDSSVWSILRRSKCPRHTGMLLLPDVAKYGLGSPCAVPQQGWNTFSFTQRVNSQPSCSQRKPCTRYYQCYYLPNLRRCLKMPGRGRSRG